MIGSKQIVIDAADFVRGMSSSPDISDGGFSTESTAVNLIATPGVLYAPDAMVDESTNLAGNIIASCGDANPLGNDRYFVTTTGKFFTWDGSTLTLRQTDGTGSYIAGTTDFVQFQLAVYATTTTDIALLTGSNLSTIDATWWTGTKGNTALTTNQRHPMVVYENSLWIGDKNKLHKWDGTTDSESVLTLSSEQSIVSLGVDVSTGKMLIGITEGTNYSNLQSHISKILVWDGFSNKPLRAVIVEDAVNAFYNISGTTFVTYGTRLGYWNGSGISFLRRFKNISSSGDELAYKHHVTNIGQTLYIADGAQILAYGEVLPGQKVFYYANSNAISSQKYTCIANVGRNNIGVGFATAKFYTCNVLAVTAIDSLTFTTNKIQFPRPVFLRSAYLEYADALATLDDNRRLLYKTQAQGAGFINLDVQGGSNVKNSSSGSVYFIENIIGFANNKVRFVQLQYTATTTNSGLRRIILYYDPAE